MLHCCSDLAPTIVSSSQFSDRRGNFGEVRKLNSAKIAEQADTSM